MGNISSITPAAKVADEPEPKATEIRVDVNRDGTKPVGIRVQIEVDSVTVLEIQAGLIKSWNEENPDQEVQPGDQILSVNGHTSQSEILTELQLTRRTHKLDIIFLRSPPPMADAPIFTAMIVRTVSRRDLGMEIEQDSKGLFVNRVRSGLARDWNSYNSRDTRVTSPNLIKPGLRILSVNGQKTPEDIMAEFHDAMTLRITLSARIPQAKKHNKELVKVVHLPFVKASACAKDDEPQVCSICLDDVDADSCVVRLACSHIFHVECATKWLTKANCACPVCRAPVEGRITGPSASPTAPTAPAAPAESGQAPGAQAAAAGGASASPSTMVRA